MGVELWAHQKICVERARARDNFALFHETGVGKTCTAINILKAWEQDSKAKHSTLILCPPIVIRQWGEEVKKYASEMHPRVILLEGTGAKRLKTLKEHKDGKWVFITNYETLLMAPILAELLHRKLDALVCDESHKLKSPTAKRTKAAVKLSENIKRKLILTGTPVLNTPMDLFTQFQVLDNGRTFGKNFFVFRAMYFYDKNASMPKHNYFPDWRPRPEMIQKIPALMAPVSMHVKKSECLDLPPLVKVELPVELGSEQKRAYEEMKEDFLTYLGGNAAVASMALTKLIRLQQIISGFVSTETPAGNDMLYKFDDVPRLDALAELLEEITPEHKVIVWACFQHNYEQIRGVCDRLKLQYVEITGERTETQKRAAVDRFRSDPGVKICIANQKAGGVGLNLIEASYSVYFSRGYSLEDDIQSEARNYRGGSERHEKVTRIDIVARGTVDDLILAALKQKQNLAEKVLDIRKALEQV